MTPTLMVLLGAGIALLIVLAVVSAEHWFDVRRRRQSMSDSPLSRMVPLRPTPGGTDHGDIEKRGPAVS